MLDSIKQIHSITFLQMKEIEMKPLLTHNLVSLITFTGPSVTPKPH